MLGRLAHIIWGSRFQQRLARWLIPCVLCASLAPSISLALAATGPSTLSIEICSSSGAKQTMQIALDDHTRAPSPAFKLHAEGCPYCASPFHSALPSQPASGRCDSLSPALRTLTLDPPRPRHARHAHRAAPRAPPALS